MLSGSNINDRQREFVNVINSSASALLNIINDILDFSKIEAGAFEIDPVPFNLKSSINDVTSLLRAAAHEKGLELIINYPANLPKNFIGDGGRLRQVITNLVGNAVKFTESGHVTIDVDIQKSRDIVICTLDVKDTGIGISPDKMSRIFDKFTQADGSTTRVYGGTGLGLTISKHIVEMMGGRMRVESELGEGSSFGFRVPLPIDPDVKEEAFDSSNIANKRVLIIDDIETNQIVFTEQLQSWGMSTDVASDGVEALNKIQSNQNEGSPYDLILLDYLMPGINGQDFAQLISNTASLNSPPIIMVSSCDQPVSTPVLSEIGINSYLLKPVRERRLFDTVVKVLSNLSERKTNPTENAEIDNMASRQTEKQEILVAEDFNLNQDVVKLMLAETMFQPVFADTGQEVLDIYMQAPDRFPMILMDVSMPVMDGYQARDCLESGMNDYLTKPVKRDQLLDKLELYSGKVTMIENIA